jgi:hypothetical protein
MTRQLVPALLFVLALAFAVAGSSPGSKRDRERETDDRGVLQAIAQAPLKTRQRHNPYGDQPDPCAREKSSSCSIVPSATARTLAESAPQ